MVCAAARPPSPTKTGARLSAHPELRRTARTSGVRKRNLGIRFIQVECNDGRGHRTKGAKDEGGRADLRPGLNTCPHGGDRSERAAKDGPEFGIAEILH